MSTCYATVETPIAFADLLAALPLDGPNGTRVWLNHQPDGSESSACLTDGKSYVWAYTGDGSDTGFDSYGMNDQTSILEAVAGHFDTRIVSEHDPDYPWDDDEI